MIGRGIVWVVDARVEFTPEEEEAINKYRLGSQVVYSSDAFKKHFGDWAASTTGAVNPLAGMIAMARTQFSLKVTINDLKKGVHLECKTLDEAITADDAIEQGCRAARAYIANASFFDGQEEVIEIENASKV